MATKHAILSALQSAKRALEANPPSQRLLLCATYCARVAPTLEAELAGVDIDGVLRCAYGAALSSTSRPEEIARLAADADHIAARASDGELGSVIDVALSLYHVVLGIAEHSELLESAERAAWGASGNQGDPSKRRDSIAEELEWQRSSSAAVFGLDIETTRDKLAVLCETVPSWFSDFQSRFPSASWTAAERLRSGFGHVVDGNEKVRPS